MNKVIAALVIVLVTGCTIVNKALVAKRKTLNNQFTITNNIVYHNQLPFAELQAMTWSLDGGELVKEMNFKLLDKRDISIIGDMIDFLSARHNGDEIEVEFEVEHDSKEFKL